MSDLLSLHRPDGSGIALDAKQSEIIRKCLGFDRDTKVELKTLIDRIKQRFDEHQCQCSNLQSEIDRLTAKKKPADEPKSLSMAADDAKGMRAWAEFISGNSK